MKHRGPWEDLNLIASNLLDYRLHKYGIMYLKIYRFMSSTSWPHDVSKPFETNFDGCASDVRSFSCKNFKNPKRLLTSTQGKTWRSFAQSKVAISMSRAVLTNSTSYDNGDQ